MSTCPGKHAAGLTQDARLPQVGDGLAVVSPWHHGGGAGARDALRVRHRVLGRVQEGDAHLVVRGGVSCVTPAHHKPRQTTKPKKQSSRERKYLYIFFCFTCWSFLTITLQNRFWLHHSYVLLCHYGMFRVEPISRTWFHPISSKWIYSVIKQQKLNKGQGESWSEMLLLLFKLLDQRYFNAAAFSGFLGLICSC